MMKRTIVFLLGCIELATHAASDNKSLTNADIERITSTSNIIELQNLMAQGKLTSKSLTQFYLDKIKSEDSKYNAIISVNPKAIELAEKSDKMRAEGQVLGLLHGIPIAVKDNIETKYMATTAGSLALKNNLTGRDAPLIQNLKAQGALIIAKANLSEWANFRSTRSSSGWSAVGGQTKNPHDVTRSTCGSSAGSGALIAANFAVAAVGTETDGSITCPASVNGITGIKPSMGLVSQQGIVPLAHSQDTAGPMTKSIVDAAIVLDGMAASNLKNKNMLMLSKQPVTIEGLKLGVLDSPATGHEKVSDLFSRFLTSLAEQKITLTPELAFSPYDGLFGDEYSVLLYEFKHDLNKYLATLPNEYNALTLKKLIEFNDKNKAQQMPYFQQEIFEMAESKGDLNESEYKTQLGKIKQATRKEGIDKLFSEHNLDAIISVTMGPTWKIDKINGDHYSGGVSSYSAISGYPHITIPLGKVHGLPIGLSIMGNANSDLKMIKIAHQLEQLIKTSTAQMH